MPISLKAFSTTLLVFVVLLIALPIQAANPLAAPIPPPRLSVNGYASDTTVGQADLMLPLDGDDAHNFYVDPNLAYGSDQQGYADLGLGYRWIQNKAAIWGVYLFGGYTRVSNNARLWVANPGVELLGRRWDAHLNAYFPFGDRNFAIADGLGATFGFNTISFAGHSEYDQFLHLDQHAGDGADIKFAYQLFAHSSLKAYVGSYFFSPAETSSVWGGAAGMEYWFDTHMKVFARYTYDNLQHNTVALGLGVEWGGTHHQRINPRLEERLTDPVERYLAVLGHASAIPTRNRYLDLGPQLLFNNIAFFSQSGAPNNGGMDLTLANCTFENPCGPSDLTTDSAEALNALLPNTRMYFNGGQYDAVYELGSSDPIFLQPGQSIHSRTPDYTQAATGAERSIFNGGFILTGNNTLNNIIVQPGATSVQNGVEVEDGDNNLITGSTITGNQIGVLAQGILTITGASIVNGSVGVTGQAAATITITGASIVNGMNIGVLGRDDASLITIMGASTVNGVNTGVVGDGGATITITNSRINVNAGANQGVGLQADTLATINSDSSLINVNGNEVSLIKAITTGGSITITNSTCRLNGMIMNC